MFTVHFRALILPKPFIFEIEFFFFCSQEWYTRLLKDTQNLSTSIDSTVCKINMPLISRLAFWQFSDSLAHVHTPHMQSCAQTHACRVTVQFSVHFQFFGSWPVIIHSSPLQNVFLCSATPFYLLRLEKCVVVLCDCFLVTAQFISADYPVPNHWHSNFSGHVSCAEDKMFTAKDLTF